MIHVRYDLTAAVRVLLLIKHFELWKNIHRNSLGLECDAKSWLTLNLYTSDIERERAVVHPYAGCSVRDAGLRAITECYVYVYGGYIIYLYGYTYIWEYSKSFWSLKHKQPNGASHTITGACNSVEWWRFHKPYFTVK